MTFTDRVRKTLEAAVDEATDRVAGVTDALSEAVDSIQQEASIGEVADTVEVVDVRNSAVVPEVSVLDSVQNRAARFASSVEQSAKEVLTSAAGQAVSSTVSNSLNTVSFDFTYVSPEVIETSGRNGYWDAVVDGFFEEARAGKHTHPSLSDEVRWTY